MDTNLTQGHGKGIVSATDRTKSARSEDFVLEKSIFSNIFEKDIQRVFIYKKAERLAKAMHLIGPAFADAPSLKNRIDAAAVGIVDAAVLATPNARIDLARELLALSSVLGIAKSGRLLSLMNIELISREAESLLQEIAAYEEPRLAFESTPTLAELMKDLGTSKQPERVAGGAKINKGHIKDIPKQSGRREAILALIKDKTSASIKDISTRIRGVSEKTIQRELQSLVSEGIVEKRGDRRWSTYTII